MDNHNLTMGMTAVKLKVNRLGYTIIKLNLSAFQSKIYCRFYFKKIFGSILFLLASQTHYEYEYPYDYQYQYQVWIAAWVSISMRVIENIFNFRSRCPFMEYE